MRLPPAIFLDLDDTILADSETADACWMSLCVRYATISDASSKSLFDAICRSRDWFWADETRHRVGRNDLQAARRQVVTRAFAEVGILESHVAHQLADDYTRERENLVRPFPGAIETLSELRLRGIEMALVTNGQSRIQRGKIERFELAQYFQCIVIEGEFGAGKPKLAVFQHALERLNRDARDVWMVGDNLAFDIEPALGLGMQAIWVDHARTGLPRGARCVPSRTIFALPEILEDE